MEKPCNSWVLALKRVCVGSEEAGKGKWALANEGKKNRELRFLEAAKSCVLQKLNPEALLSSANEVTCFGDRSTSA